MIKIEIKGLDKVHRKFGKLPREIKNELREGIIKSAFIVERKSKPITPVDTGRLRASITKDIEPFKATIGPRVDYAIFVHEGTRNWPLHIPPKMPGTVRQFMKIGAERAEHEIRRVFEEAIRKALAR
ncbi:MAG: HK97-gp10 family putative phage morphogenesis protein [Candidatus Hodarchaeales archaeon]